jgi:hypothetical protein
MDPLWQNYAIFEKVVLSIEYDIGFISNFIPMVKNQEEDG